MKPETKIPCYIGRDSLRIALTGIVALSALAIPAFAQENPAEPPTAPPFQKELEERNMVRYALTLPVSVRLNNATLKQMAETVSKVAKLSIRVDDSLPQTVRLTVEAHRIPLATLLEEMARRADVLIDYDKDKKGILLTRPAVLKFDEMEQPIGRDATFPWSVELGIKPNVWDSQPRTAGNLPLTRLNERSVSPAELVPGISGINLTAPYSNTPPTTVNAITPGLESRTFPNIAGNPNQNFLYNQNQNQNLTYTPVGDSLLVVSEPGKGEKGEAGVWLTVYRIEKNGSIGKVGTLFHPYKETPINILVPGTSPTPSLPTILNPNPVANPSLSIPTPQPDPAPVDPPSKP